jgi:hypothetical protein
MRKRLGGRDVDPNDPDNRNLVVIYYVIKNLSQGKPSTTQVVDLLS